jgi:hypothetical protein
MTKPTSPDMYVLDALVSDLESLDGILRVLNSDTELGWRQEWGGKFLRPEIVQALARLIQADLVRSYLSDELSKGLVEGSPRMLPPGDFDDAWFGITERGRLVHTNWEPPLGPSVA